MRIIVAGGRNFNQYQKLKDELNTYIDSLYNEKVEIVSGHAKGADVLGEIYAQEKGLSYKIMPAQWTRNGVVDKSAGMRRNVEMAKYAAEDNSVLFAFWDGESKGTKHMINMSKKYGLDVHVVRYKRKSYRSVVRK